MKNKVVEDFKSASSTGKSVILLKAISDCDCFNSNDLFNSEPDPHCTKCYGTGKKRLKIITEKIRFDYQGNNNTSKESNSIIENYEDKVVFYLPEIYHSVNNLDIIAIPTEPMRCYVVENTFPNIYNDFRYYEVLGKKIPFLNMKEVV